MGRKRARQAGGCTGRADRGTELHEPLVEIPGRSISRECCHDLVSVLPQPFLAAGALDVVVDGKYAGQHAGDVAVDQ